MTPVAAFPWLVTVGLPDPSVEADSNAGMGR